jgi:cell wall-associated NlpC family hydrolase
MSELGDDLANAAQTLVGAAFRLHGRDPATGLDCLGLVGRALEDCGRSVRYPQGYRLRNADIAPWLGFAARNGLRRCAGPDRRGDVLLIEPGPGQHHLLIAIGEEHFVHAHAGLRRVVIQHFPFPQPPLAQWRLDPDPEQIWQR